MTAAGSLLLLFIGPRRHPSRAWSGRGGGNSNRDALEAGLGFLFRSGYRGTRGLPDAARWLAAAATRAVRRWSRRPFRRPDGSSSPSLPL